MWYNSFVPSKKLIIVGIIITILWFFLFKFNLGIINCKDCIESEICESNLPRIFTSCDCCFEIGDFLVQVLILLFPFIILYLVSSLFKLYKYFIK